MQHLQRLLFDSFDRHRGDAATTIGLQEGFRIRAVGLVPSDIRSHVLARQQPHAQMVRLRPLAQ